MPFGIHLEYVTNGWNPPILRCGDAVTVNLDSELQKLNRVKQLASTSVTSPSDSDASG